MAQNDSSSTYRTCTSCRAEIRYGATYFVCNVSTCNRARLGLFFCSVSCWDAHLPEARHRDAWAEERTAPTREVAMREASGSSGDELPTQPRRVVVAPAPTGGGTPRAATAPAPSGDLPVDVLVVVSKLKAYVKARSGMNTSDGVVDVLSDALRKLCDAAIKVAAADGRKTVMDRDFRVVVDTRWGDD